MYGNIAGDIPYLSYLRSEAWCDETFTDIQVTP